MEEVHNGEISVRVFSDSDRRVRNSLVMVDSIVAGIFCDSFVQIERMDSFGCIVTLNILQYCW